MMPEDTPEILNFDNVVVFEKPAFRPNECTHSKVTISVRLSTIECNDCHEKLNPIVWMSDYLKQLKSWKNRVLRAAARAEAIQSKLDQTGDFLCSHCHRISSINLGKLVSNAAVARRMTLLEEEINNEGD